MTEMKGASGLRTLFTCARTDGKSLIQCRLKLLKTASKVFAWNGSSSEVGRTSLIISISLLKGRSASRCSSVAEDSAAVILPTRLDRGPFSGSSGDGSVRAFAMLHALAPRSRTWGKWRLMSCQC
jgi:hypothetical protein